MNSSDVVRERKILAALMRIAADESERWLVRLVRVHDAVCAEVKDGIRHDK